MPNVYQPRLIQIRAAYDTNVDSGDHPENIFWFQSATGSAPTVSQLHAICNVFDAGWYPVWAKVGTSNRHYIGSTATDWSSDLGLQATSVGTYTPEPGAAGATGMPAQVAALISWSNGQRFKGGHFRTYLPWLGAGALLASDHNQLDPTVQGNVGTAIDTWLSEMLSSGQLGGQTQKLYRHRNNVATAALYSVSEYSVQLGLATQRRRLRRAAHT